MARAMLSLCLVLLLADFARAQTSRDMAALNWMEFRELVPAKVATVLLPTGTLEAHGVINNGADITAPVDIAASMAPRINALVAPVVPYGVTGSLDAFAGNFTIPESAFRPYVKAVLEGLARQRFRNIIVVNGHGGPQSAILGSVAEEVGREQRVRTLVIDWWSYCSDVTIRTFGEDGGHAGWNETAYVQAVDPKLVHPERYKESLASPLPQAGSWKAYPFPSSIMLYKPGQGYPKFDAVKAAEYRRAVIEKMTGLVADTIKKWDEARIFLE